ncbi:MAG: hypothetical protein IKG27_02620 [Bacilli bacterium]|nr:hypothetical protein [Bacilli bacterium]
MQWIEEFYNFEDIEDKDERELESSILDDNVVEEDMFLKISEIFDSYKAIMELFDIDEDITEAISIIDERFEIALIKLEENYGVSKDEIDNYIAKRDEILKPYIEAKNKAI